MLNAKRLAEFQGNWELSIHELITNWLSTSYQTISHINLKELRSYRGSKFWLTSNELIRSSPLDILDSLGLNPTKKRLICIHHPIVTNLFATKPAFVKGLGLQYFLLNLGNDNIHPWNHNGLDSRFRKKKRKIEYQSIIANMDPTISE